MAPDLRGEAKALIDNLPESNVNAAVELLKLLQDGESDPEALYARLAARLALLKDAAISAKGIQDWSRYLDDL